MRQRRTDTSTQHSPTLFPAPGELVKEACRRHGWEIGSNNLMLEGTTDESYFYLASKLYEADCGKKLIGDDFRIFAVGELDDGGTEAMNDKMSFLSNMLKIDPYDENGQKIRVVALFDDDNSGRNIFKKMSKKYRPWGDIFLLRRKYPRDTRDPVTFQKNTEKINEIYQTEKKSDCEIEDLIDRTLINLFVETTQGCLQRPIEELGEGFHCDFHGWAKGKLKEFVKKEAGLEEVKMIVDLLKSLRYLLKLPVDGV
ncbi:hypothetical protein [Gimesia chilikensis]|uniref:hypothetical protein n=1 Tax=Gimesia chilikensis TaxID=2605989 RepID=UPI0011882A4D|nr:hypothetical protein [Gimesia chilikensis]QDT84769.1 hypothetical protein MalM14_24320 [Gimesia chilikensis]